MAAGRITVLNGGSSTGKTSMARALQAQWDGTLLYLGLDTVLHEVLGPAAFRQGARAAEGVTFRPLPGCEPPRVQLVYGPGVDWVVSALHQSVALLAERGYDLVVDHVLTERRWLEECVRLWRDLPVLFVRAQCPWEVVEARVRGRTDRPGLTLPLFLSIARWQFDSVHAHVGNMYDLTVDTAHASPEECAARIVRYWREAESPSAFRRLATRLGLAAPPE
jgi:chloramphenicol 3-O phosphotransferase